MQVTAVKRVFQHNDLKLPDPDPSLEPKEVIEFYSSTYPELTNSFIEKDEIIDDEQVFTIETSVGTKG